MTTFPTTRAVSVDAGVDRVLVGGKDITWFRTEGVMGPHMPTQVPGYTLMEPFAYGASQLLVIPRTNSNYGDRPGHGDLSWLKEQATVRYQRVDADGNVIATDYRGVITSLHATSREWVAQVDGELSARANLIDRPPSLLRRKFDIGHLVTFTMEGLGFKISPRFPETGVEIVDPGGTTAAGSLSTWCALARTHNNNPWAIMPTTWGGNTWTLAEKDTTTKHFTVLSDGSRIVLNLVDDLAEKPNTIYGSGVTPKGLRYRGAEYPGFFQGEPAPYPYSDTSTTFGVGTTNAETDTGDGITVLARKLSQVGYLDDDLSRSSTYSNAMATAVNILKDRAGLPQNGTITLAAWNALWNIDIVGYSPEGARIFPMARDTKTQRFLYSSTGDVIGTNPDFVPETIRVDRSIDFGICDEWMARAYARSLIVPVGARRWTGTITLNGVSVFAGEHDSADVGTLTGADIMPARDIRPGMNAWLPYFDGGTLLHVAGVDVSGTTVTLTVSAAALDIFDLTQALERAADSKRNVYREWRQTLHGAKAPNNFTQRDKLFGVLDRDIALTGRQWNVVPVIVGQSGSVSQALLELSIPTEFYYAVFAKNITPSWLNGHVGNPKHIDDNGATPWENPDLDQYFQNRDLILVEGQGGQPCGYFWRKGYFSNGDRTSAPLTGSFLSHATWTYATDPQGLPVVYVAIWPEDDCSLLEGRIFDALEDDVT